jgi:putative transcriptional regulator
MKMTGLILVEHNPGDPPIETGTDWAAVEALTDEQIKAAVRDDPDAVPIGFFNLPGFHLIPNVKRLREKLGMTQDVFAATYRIPLGTLRDWEQERKIPDATARAYLTVIARTPDAVAKALVPAS